MAVDTLSNRRPITIVTTLPPAGTAGGSRGRSLLRHVLVRNENTRAPKKELAKGHLEEKRGKPVMET